eukprot:scaffold105132_cov38-Prasinocladus_malaysianus.AAC.2
MQLRRRPASAPSPLPDRVFPTVSIYRKYFTRGGTCGVGDHINHTAAQRWQLHPELNPYTSGEFAAYHQTRAKPTPTASAIPSDTPPTSSPAIPNPTQTPSRATQTPSQFLC